MKIELVKINKNPVTVVAGKYAFPIENGRIAHNECSRVGAEYNGNIKDYNDAYELACFAYENNIYDSEIDNY